MKANPARRGGWGLWYNVALGLVRNSGNKILLVRRGGAEYSGFWGLPGGKFTFSESGREAIVRELEEETGLTRTDCSPPMFIGLGLERLEEYDKGKFRLKARWQLYYFSLRVLGTKGVTPNCRWFSDDELVSKSSVVIPSVIRAVQIDRDRGAGRLDFFFMEDTIRSKDHRLVLTDLRVDTFSRQTAVEGP